MEDDVSWNQQRTRRRVKLDVGEDREGRERLWSSICSLCQKLGRKVGEASTRSGEDMMASGDDPGRVWRRQGRSKPGGASSVSRRDVQGSECTDSL
jgi:hypothetical protein